jgi:pilus assembly protein Flp/PilA
MRQSRIVGVSALAMFLSALVQDQPPTRSGAHVLSLIATLQTLGFAAKDRLRDEKGATAVEYGIMVALIAVVIIAAVSLLGTQINDAFTSITNEL